MNLVEAELIMPSRQADNTPPYDPDPPGKHVGEHVKVLRDLGDAKFNTKVSINAVMRLASVASVQLMWPTDYRQARRGCFERC